MKPAATLLLCVAEIATVAVSTTDPDQQIRDRGAPATVAESPQ